MLCNSVHHLPAPSASGGQEWGGSYLAEDQTKVIPAGRDKQDLAETKVTPSGTLLYLLTTWMIV